MEEKEVVPISKRKYSLAVILTVQSLQISVYVYKKRMLESRMGVLHRGHPTSVAPVPH